MDFVIINLLNSVNAAFDLLRTLIPTKPADRKLSKFEILRLACCYINHLNFILKSSSEGSEIYLNNTEEKQILPEWKNHGSQICTFCISEQKYSHVSLIFHC